MDGQTIEGLLEEERRFPPLTPEKVRTGIVDRSLEDAAALDPEAFWADQARTLEWIRPFRTVLDGELPHVRWFADGTLNASVNCIDRHVAAGKGDRVAFHWEGEPGDTRTITYSELLDDVSRTANALLALGVTRGDRVAVYLPMIPELAITMLACSRIGAVHSVVFGGFSANALRERIEDSACRVLVTADGAHRRGATFPLKQHADEAVAEPSSIERVLVVRRTGEKVTMLEGRDVWWHDLVPDQTVTCPPEEMGAEDLLFLLYTSGTTGRPKGIMHTTGGYLTQTSFTHRAVFDLDPERDVYWCAADIGWVTGHSYIVYGPLANGATSVMFEGTPNFPREDRFWEIVARYGVTQLYTAPTAIRAFMKWGRQHPDGHDLSSLRILGSVGEPINPEAWMWYRDVIGGGHIPVVDTWWQTETGAMMIAPLPGVTTLKPGSATTPLPGISATIVDDRGDEVPAPGGGYLVLDRPWPAMLRGIWGDEARYRETYWSRFPGRYFAGDGAKRDADGSFWLLGRVDDVMNVSGHRLSTTEVESALVSHPSVAEAAVIGRADPLTGQAISAFVTTREGFTGDEALAAELREHVSRMISPIAKPASLLFTADLPKTRSGKIMRRLLRDIAEDAALGDTTTLADAGIVDAIKSRYLAAPVPDDAS